MPDIQLLCGLASGLISAIAYLPYTRAILRGRCRPQRASWLIWTVLGSIGLFSQWVEGASASLLFGGAQLCGSVVVSILSIRYGAGNFLSRQDGAILVLAALGIVSYLLTDTAAYALALSISISALGGVATVIKAFHQPASEDISAWVAGTVSAVFAAGAVGTFAPLLLAYPLYMFLINGAVVIAILWGRARGRHGGLPGGLAT